MGFNYHFASKLAALANQESILGVGARLTNSELGKDEIHPIILPGKSYSSQIVIDQAHRQTLYGGTQVTLIHVREKFWILGGRALIRSFIVRCVICARYRARRAQQLTGQLLADRVVPVRPFYTTGVDYAGSLTLKMFQRRGAKTYKRWIAVFVCFITSAVYLELVSDNSTEAFIKAYRCFVSRRGASSVLYSDCGTDFKGADSFLKDLFRQSESENAQLISSLA
ncbi:uncharacterized protein [Chelonus insularis]|uniref:uncharacterized protein n=1 Tax=Chelonus insularis TaxID=460826 RepID=UPI00158ACE49|nr:uncharacterized protein LOC118069892 [Chelonus insularis]